MLIWRCRRIVIWRQFITKCNLSSDPDRGAQGLADGLPYDEVGVAVVGRGALVDQYDGVPAEVVEEAGGGIDVKGCAAHDQSFGAHNVRDRALDGLVVKRFLIEDDVWLDVAAAGAKGDAVAVLDVVEVEAFPAVQAVVAGHRAVQLPDALAARFGVQCVDVLGHDGDEFPFLFKFGQSQMRLVGLYALY